jgi:NHLM bacteriocin system ABC transporter peptidase/ATP-binding protein
METVECGAAALGIILGYYGRLVPLAELRQACGVSRDGSTAAHMLQAARHYGLIATGLTRDLGTLRELRCPYVVFWNFNHFVVVEGFRRGHVSINDPATGPRTVSLEEFDQAFTGVVLTMEPGPDFTLGGHRPSTGRMLCAWLRGSGGALAYCLAAGFLLVLPGLVVAVCTQVFIDHMLMADMQDWLRPLLCGMLCTAAFRAVLLHLRLRALRRLQLRLAAVMSSRFLWHLLHLPVSFYAQRYAGEISHRLHLNDKVADVLSGRLATTIIDASMMLVYAGVMLQYDAVLTLLGLGCALMNVVALQWLSRRRVDANRRVVQEFGKVYGVSMAGLQQIETLKASALEAEFFARWAGSYAKAINAQQTLGTANQTLGVLPALLTALTSMLVLVIGGLRVMDGHLSIGMLVALQSLMRSFLTPVTTLVGFGSTLQELQGDLERLDDVLRNPTHAESAETSLYYPVTPATCRLQGQAEVRGVTFGYSRVSPPVLDHVSFTLAAGQQVAVVGASGSGKSTLAKLLCGLYAPWEGEILFDGRPRADIPQPVLAYSMAMVDQDMVFFAGTVRENLTLWDDTVPDSQLVQACKDAVIHDVVVAMPGGYDTALLEGAANLSGGQRQRLEIARALVQHPAVMVLDEATSALDAETEYRVIQHLRRRACTCIIVAHRLSTIRDCDEIIVLDRGKVVQRGTHDALLRAGGEYARLLRDEGETHEQSELSGWGWSSDLARPAWHHAGVQPLAVE